MEWIRRKDENLLGSALWRLYEESFPVYEQRDWPSQQKAMGDQHFYCMEVQEQGQLAGLLWYWQWGKLCYVEHFAVEGQRRGQGLGSRILKEFCSCHDLIVLEIDPPEDEISIKRQAFYERCGFSVLPYPHTHPPYRMGHAAHRLVVMATQGGKIPLFTEEEYRQFYSLLANNVMCYAQHPDKGGK